MTKALLTISDGNYALAVTIPGNVVDAAGDDGILSFGHPRPVGGTVPDSYDARCISGCHVEAGRGEASNRSSGCVLSVLGRDGGIVN